MCLRGASGVEQVLLAEHPDSRLRAYVVWVPMLGGEEKDVPVATRLVPDPRATHYWDGSGFTIRAYRSILDLGEDAWDVYLVYGPGAKWEGELPPKPDYWMHQLGSPEEPRVKGPYFDPDVFADTVTSIMASAVVVTCPRCGHASAETPPLDACVYFFECPGCREVLRPKAGDCCIFCSYGSAPCPPRGRANPSSG